MNTAFLFAAGCLAAASAGAHVFLGGPRDARTVLEAAGIPTAPRATEALAWHAASPCLVFVAVALTPSAIGTDTVGVLVFTTIHCVLVAVLTTAMARRSGPSCPLAPRFTPMALYGASAFIF